MVSTRARSGGVSSDQIGSALQPETGEQVQQPPPATPSRGRRSSRTASGSQAEQPQEHAGPTSSIQEEGVQHPASPSQPPSNQQQQHQAVYVQQQVLEYAPALSDVSEHSEEAAAGQEGEADSEGDVMEDLAASIRAALSKRAQGASSSHHTAAPAAAAAAAGRGAGSSQGLDPSQLAWQPNTGLRLPTAAAAMPFAKVTGPLVGGPLRHKQQQQQQQQQGPLPGPSAAAGAILGVDSSAAAQRGKQGAAPQPKEAGLAKQLVAPSRDTRQIAKAAAKAKPDTAGPGWYHLPATPITEDVKRDLRLLRLRGAFDPKRHYKTFDTTKFPKHFVFGTVVDDPLDYYGGRLSAKERKANLTEQLLADAELTHSRKKRYAGLQAEATKFKKVKKRKTEQPRKHTPKHRPKH